MNEVDGAGNGHGHDAKVSIRDRWEAVRYGQVGRFLGYAGAFAAIFVLIILLIWIIENSWKR